ncbi:galactosylceramide sulfotransferase-like [Dreissena polymorpha]|uniref:galactosylceramide sulfotransferase-like n=1 Tax=Dreissena polymorpha TaxID=45954 RepID=UPI00226446FF|nr:galactosylceramide sulfotransferase-like [Dreissena polymorpha]
MFVLSLQTFIGYKYMRPKYYGDLKRSPGTYIKDTDKLFVQQPNSTNVSRKLVHSNNSGPVRHIGFLKVHKAASTTSQAIFLRFGWRRNLNFVLPPQRNAFKYPNIISLNESVTPYNTLPPPAGQHFDILCHHVLYGRDQWASVMPKDFVVVGTVREPFSHFKSILNYFQPVIIKILEAKDDNPVRTFLESPKKYDSKKPQRSLLNNRLAIEYGVDPDIIAKRNNARFKDYLYNVLDKQFAVVIPAERFDEGIILMKRRLRWSLNDIMYVQKNVRNVTRPDRFPVMEDLNSLHREYFKFDYMIYHFFVEKFNREVYMEGLNFPREVEYFKKTRHAVQLFCHGKGKSIKQLKIPSSEFNEEFTITKDDCTIMLKGEIAFTQMIRLRQYGSVDLENVKRKA